MFKSAPNIANINKAREFKTHDIVKRLGVISPNRLHIKNHPIDTPISVFNSTIIIKGDKALLYSRIIMGYFMYISAIVRIEIPLDDIFSGAINISHYPCDLVLYPTTKYDIWGAEDPRITEVNGKMCITYVGRNINYFNSAITKERTLPIVSVATDKQGKKWNKLSIIVLPSDIRNNVISDKDAFIIKSREGDLLVFHRPHMADGNYYLTISKLDMQALTTQDIREQEVRDLVNVLTPSEFEIKLGWSTPPIEVEPNLYLLLIHGVDKYIEGYRVFAALVRYDRDIGPYIEAITPYYIMEPKTSYEVYGDRPFVVFPCGLCKVNKSKAIITYGAADYVIGFGELDLDELLSILDKYRFD